MIHVLSDSYQTYLPHVNSSSTLLTKAFKLLTFSTGLPLMVIGCFLVLSPDVHYKLLCLDVKCKVVFLALSCSASSAANLKMTWELFVAIQS